MGGLFYASEEAVKLKVDGRLAMVDSKTYLEKSKRTFWRVMRIDALIMIGLIAYLMIESALKLVRRFRYVQVTRDFRYFLNPACWLHL